MILPERKILSDSKVWSKNIKIYVLPRLFYGAVFFVFGVYMETRIAVISIIVEKSESAESINSILHEYGEYIIGRMGIPYRRRGVNIISIALEAPQNTVAALSGKIGKIDGVSVKTAYSGAVFND